MLHVLHGTDRTKVLDAQHTLLERLLKEEPGTDVATLDDETFAPESFAHHLGAAGLFMQRHIVVLADLLEHDDYGDIVRNHLADMAVSENIFIIRDGKLPAKTSAACKKYAQECTEFLLKEKAGAKAFSLFSLADALGMRDKKRLWLLYQQALRDGHAAEEIHGILAWQMKTLVQIANGATDGIKPFVLGKGKRALMNYKNGDANKKYFDLIAIYHEARRGGLELPLALERLILSL